MRKVLEAELTRSLGGHAAAGLCRRVIADLRGRPGYKAGRHAATACPTGRRHRWRPRRTPALARWARGPADGAPGGSGPATARPTLGAWADSAVPARCRLQPRPRRPRGTPMGQVDAELMALIRRLTGGTAAAGGPAADLGEPRRPDASAYGSCPAHERSADGAPAGRAQPDPRPPRRAAPGLARRARSHGDRRHRQPVRPDPVRPQGAAADGAPDRPPAAAGAARGARRPELLLVAQAPGAPLRQPHRLAGQRVRGLRRATTARQFLQACANWCRRSSRATSTRSSSTSTKLASLESFVAEQARREVAGAAATPPRCWPTRKAELRVQQRYAQQLRRRPGGLSAARRSCATSCRRSGARCCCALRSSEGADGARVRAPAPRRRASCS